MSRVGDRQADERTNTIGLVVHPHKSVVNSVRMITEFARAHQVVVVAREADGERVGSEVTLIDADEFADRVDAIVSLGGDGTMLAAMRLVVDRAVPVLGVNHGNLGFLVEVEPSQLEVALARLVEGTFTLEPHSCLDAGIGTAAGWTAFNDIVLAPAEQLTGMSVDLLVNEQRYGYYRGDALVACTPTGSTAYNYAAGGPVISPSCPSIALTPVAPMSGISRSVVLGAGDTISLANPSSDQSLRVSVDGIPTGTVGPLSALSLRLHTDAVSLIRLDAGLHTQRARVKLSLLDLPLRPDQLLELIPPALRERAERLRDTAS